MKIWFLTRALHPYQKTGGGQIRLGQVKNLEMLGWDVTTIMPNYDSSLLNESKTLVQIPFTKNLKFEYLLQRIGVREDYLDKWVENAFDFLKNKISANDILFATCGGELGMIKLASLCKRKFDCKFVINFHDPIDYSFVGNHRLNNKPHISREVNIYKYIQNSDLIVTSSKVYQKVLHDKYPELSHMIVNNYFGYIAPLDVSIYNKKIIKKLKVAYVGNMSITQGPEILYTIYSMLNDSDKNNIEIYFIGNTQNYKPLASIKNDSIKFIPYMEHNDFLKFMVEKIDVGFVSLAKSYFSACVPSKIYEYLNLEIPIFGALPRGDSLDLINKNKFGLAAEYDNISGLVHLLTRLINDEILVQDINLAIKKQKNNWSMNNRVKELNNLLRRIS